MSTFKTWEISLTMKYILILNVAISNINHIFPLFLPH